ncbi:MAG: bifunctional methylenetetrahydrofolate dehydrogenase/methenyltetrahydrofolate cyclohydrolase FolD [Candidatus Melainabacteria bacterium]
MTVSGHSQPASPVLLDGKQMSGVLLASLTDDIAGLKQQTGVTPRLVVILVGEDPASQVYVNKKAKVARSIGMASDVIVLPADIPAEVLQGQIAELNADATVHGILVQLPLPRHLNSLAILSGIDPAKDVDGLHPMNMGKLLAGMPDAVEPCTPRGMMTMLHLNKVPVAGKHAVVVGRSNIVGKPIALMLLRENATVTVCHSRTQNLPEVTRQADILVAAVGIPRFITGDHVKAGVVVLDVGINRVDGKLVGDVDAQSVSAKAALLTPVPGGVGPMTIATLMENTLLQYRRALKLT